MSEVGGQMTEVRGRPHHRDHMCYAHREKDTAQTQHGTARSGGGAAGVTQRSGAVGGGEGGGGRQTTVGGGRLKTHITN